jgi:hypothetical protein
MKKYKIKITPYHAADASYVLELETENLEWSMEQYQRNRDPLKWEILEENAD